MVTNDFTDGVVKFTNASDEDFMALWNNKEYTFPAKTTCPMVIPNEPSENIQEICKKFAMKYAQRELSKSKAYKAIEKEAAKHISPATYDEKILQEYVDQCLAPLPIGEASVKDIPKQKIQFRDGGSAILGEGANVAGLSSADGAFKEYIPPELGAMGN